MRCLAISGATGARSGRIFAREPREVEDNDEMNLALVRPAELEKPLQLRTVGGLCALPFFPEPLENFVTLPAAVLLARAELCRQAEVFGLLLRAHANVDDCADHPR